GAPTGFAGGYEHSAPVGESRCFPCYCVIGMIVSRAYPFRESDRRASSMYIRINTDYRAPARSQKLCGVLDRMLHQSVPVADPCNRHQSRYFLVPNSTVDETSQAVNPRPSDSSRVSRI